MRFQSVKNIPKKLEFHISSRTLFRPVRFFNRTKDYLKRLWSICLAPSKGDRAKITHLEKLRCPREAMPYRLSVRINYQKTLFLTGGKPL